MINMFKLGYTPRACCWVHKRGQVQGLLAMSVFRRIALAYCNLHVPSSEAGSGKIHIYDGRGNETPLETVSKLHKSPVHLMTVCA